MEDFQCHSRSSKGRRRFRSLHSTPPAMSVIPHWHFMQGRPSPSYTTKPFDSVRGTLCMSAPQLRARLIVALSSAATWLAWSIHVIVAVLYRCGRPAQGHRLRIRPVRRSTAAPRAPLGHINPGPKRVDLAIVRRPVKTQEDLTAGKGAYQRERHHYRK